MTLLLSMILTRPTLLAVAIGRNRINKGGSVKVVTSRKAIWFPMQIAWFFILLSGLTPLTQAQQNMSNDDLWGAVNSGLYGLAKGAGYGEGHYLQMSAFPTPAAWAEK